MDSNNLKLLSDTFDGIISQKVEEVINSKLDELTRILREKMDAAPPKEFLSASEVATYTGYKESYIRLLVNKQEIPVYRPTEKKIIFKRSEIDLWLSRNRQRTIDEIRKDATTRVVLQKYKKN